MAVVMNLTDAFRGPASQSSTEPAASGFESEFRLREALGLGVLFERVLEAIVVARLSSGRIVLWNPAAVKLFGYTAEEAVGQSLEMLMPAPIGHVHRAGLDRYMRTGHGLIVDADSPVEMPAVTRSGDNIRIELSLSELRSPSGERYAVAVIRDAMQRKALELTNLELMQARVARSEIEAELAERDELLHTVGTTLDANPGAGELQQLAGTLADFRRLHSGQLAVKLATTDLVDILHAAADAARRRSTGRRMLIHTPPNAWVRCDPARMRQVIDQVLDETIRRTSGGARIELRLEMVSSHLAQLTIRSDACGDTRPAGASLQLSRTLLQRQGGTFATAISSGGSLEVVMTLPGSPHPARRRPSRKSARPTAR